jgi:hypothetical protein
MLLAVLVVLCMLLLLQVILTLCSVLFSSLLVFLFPTSACALLGGWERKGLRDWEIGGQEEKFLGI